MSDWGMISLPQPKLFKPMYNDPKFSDVTLKAGGSNFYVSKLILSRSSEYFYKLFFGGFHENSSKEVELHNDDETAMEAILKFIYGLEYYDSDKESLVTYAKVYAVAEKYDIGGLRECAAMAMRIKISQLNETKPRTIFEEPDLGANTKFDINSTIDATDEIDYLQKEDNDQITLAVAQPETNRADEDIYEAIKIVYTFTTEKDELARPLLAA